jgi:mycothiol synthase
LLSPVPLNPIVLLNCRSSVHKGPGHLSAICGNLTCTLVDHLMNDTSSSPESSFETRDVLDSDWDAIADLINQYETGGVTGDIMRDRHSQRTEGDFRLLKVATSPEGGLLCYCRSSRRASEPEGIFRINVFVEPLFSGRGLGRQMLRLTEDFARQHGALFPMSSVEETCKRGIDFATKSGYATVQHLFESRLDLAGFDPSPYVVAQSCLEDEGFRFVSFEDLGETEEHWRKLYDLDCSTDLDTPGSEYWNLGTFEEYVCRVKSEFKSSFGGILAAVLDGRWIGVNMVREATNGTEMHTAYTGVLREFRGKGIAQVLKVIGIQRAIALGLQTIQTNNDERNATMLAINRKLGFVEQPGFFVVRKEF